MKEPTAQALDTPVHGQTQPDMPADELGEAVQLAARRAPRQGKTRCLVAIPASRIKVKGTPPATTGGAP